MVAIIRIGTPDAPAFNDALKNLRTDADLSWRDIARRCGVKAKLVGRWESGEEIPTPRQFSRLRNICFRGLGVYRRALEDRWRGRGHADAEIDTALVETGAEPADDAAAVAEIAAKPAPPRPQDAASFGQALFRARAIEGMSQGDLAELLNVNDSSISNWERDTCIPIHAHHQQLLDLLPVLTMCPPPSKGLPQDIPKPGPASGTTGRFAVVSDRPTLGPGAAGAIVTDAPAPPAAPPVDRQELLRAAGTLYAEALARQADAEGDERQAEEQSSRIQAAADRILSEAQETADRMLEDATARTSAAASKAMAARNAAADAQAALMALVGIDRRPS